MATMNNLLGVFCEEASKRFSIERETSPLAEAKVKPGQILSNEPKP